jgi:hypothetical protein
MTRKPGRKLYAHSPQYKDFRDHLTTIGTYTLSIPSSLLESEAGDTSLASRLKSVAESKTCATEESLPTATPLQSSASGLSTAHASEATSHKFNLAELAGEAVVLVPQNLRKDDIWVRMNELRIMMHLHGYRNLQFREGISFTSDDQWDQNFPLLGNSSLPHYKRLRLNAARLLLILILHKMGKTEEKSVQGFLGTTKPIQGMETPTPLSGAEGIEMDWDSINSPFQICWARLKSHGQALRAFVNEQQIESSRPNRKRRKKEPSREVSWTADIARILTSSVSSDSVQERSIQYESLLSPETPPAKLRRALEHRFPVVTACGQQGRFIVLTLDDVNRILEIAKDLGVPEVHQTFLKGTLLPFFAENTFLSEGDDVLALIGYIRMTAS